MFKEWVCVFVSECVGTPCLILVYRTQRDYIFITSHQLRSLSYKHTAFFILWRISKRHKSGAFIANTTFFVHGSLFEILKFRFKFLGRFHFHSPAKQEEKFQLYTYIEKGSSFSFVTFEALINRLIFFSFLSWILKKGQIKFSSRSSLFKNVYTHWANMSFFPCVDFLCKFATCMVSPMIVCRNFGKNPPHIFGPASGVCNILPYFWSLVGYDGWADSCHYQSSQIISCQNQLPSPFLARLLPTPPLSPLLLFQTHILVTLLHIYIYICCRHIYILTIQSLNPSQLGSFVCKYKLCTYVLCLKYLRQIVGTWFLPIFAHM